MRYQNGHGGMPFFKKLLPMLVADGLRSVESPCTLRTIEPKIDAAAWEYFEFTRAISRCVCDGIFYSNTYAFEAGRLARAARAEPGIPGRRWKSIGATFSLTRSLH